MSIGLSGTLKALSFPALLYHPFLSPSSTLTSPPSEIFLNYLIMLIQKEVWMINRPAPKVHYLNCLCILK